MFKEIEKFVKKTFQPISLPLGERHTLTDCFKRDIQTTLNGSLATVLPLKGRMQEIASQSKKILEQILCIEQHVGQDVLKHIAQIVEPLIGQIQKIQMGKLSEEEMSVYCSAWEKKAKLWLDLKHHSDNRAKVIMTVTKLVFVGIKERIDQDLTIIENYQLQSMAQLKLSQKEQYLLLERMKKSLAVHLEALNLLKEIAPPLELQHVADWKAHIDQTRSDLFENALQEIDSLVESFHVPLVKSLKFGKTAS